jgi:hypothetical protein
MMGSRRARRPPAPRSCGVCGEIGHTITNCQKYEVVARVRIEQVLEQIDQNDWVIPRAEWSLVRERLDLAVDSIEVDVALALATVEDVLERWPRDRARPPYQVGFHLAPAWHRLVAKGGRALELAAARSD